MDCVIAAGGRPDSDDPLYPFTGGKPKALIDMGGRAMVERVVDALQSSDHVDEIVIVGLNEDDRQGLSFAKPVSYLSDQGSLVGNARAGVEWSLSQRPSGEEILLCSADIPLITSDIVNNYVESCLPFEHLGFYTFVTKQVMEKRFPDSNRTFVKLQGLEVAGGDLVLVKSRIVHTNDEFWTALTDARKHAWKLARLVGFRFLIKFLLRRLSIAEIEAVVERVLGERVVVRFSPYAELAMDADKPGQVELIRREFRREFE